MNPTPRNTDRKPEDFPPEFHYDRPSAHDFRARERKRAAAGLIPIRDLIPEAIRELLRERGKRC